MIIGGATQNVELVQYSPGLLGGVDLEAATKTITATAESATPDYTTTLTMAAPTDSRISVLRLAMRLAVTVDSFTGAGAVLNYRVKLAGASVATGTITTGASTGAKLVNFDIAAGTLTGALIFTIFFWVDADTAVISVVTPQVGIGSVQAAATAPCLSFAGKGLVQLRGDLAKAGAGNFQYTLGTVVATLTNPETIVVGAAAASFLFSQLVDAGKLFVLPKTLYVYLWGITTPTDIPYINTIGFAQFALL
jgi:hypothetical protein